VIGVKLTVARLIDDDPLIAASLGGLKPMTAPNPKAHARSQSACLFSDAFSVSSFCN
jgi:hypothetical protein